MTRVTELRAVLAWMATRTRVPSAADIQTRFGCSRATAYRWRKLHQHTLHPAILSSSVDSGAANRSDFTQEPHPHD